MSLTHLKIKQATSSIEVVTPAIIEKLYQLTQTKLDEASDIQGNLQVVHAYSDSVDYLLNKYANLHINVTGGTYIRFTDSTVANLCATNWGDGAGLTTLQAATVSSLGTVFNANTSITSFNELVKFTSLTTISSLAFQKCSALVSITLPANCTSLGNGFAFDSCSSLTTVTNTNNVSALCYCTFCNCSKLTSLALSSCTSIGGSAFQNCNLLTTVGDVSSVTSVDDGAFCGCSVLTTLNFSTKLTGTLGFQAFNECHALTSVGNITGVTSLATSVFQACHSLPKIKLGNVTNIGQWAFYNCESLLYVTISATSVPTIQDATFGGSTTCKIYVPDASVSAYQAATNWSNIASRIYSMTQFAIDYPND